MLRLGRIHRLAVVSRIVLWRENYHRAILDFCNNICHERTSEMVRPGSMNEFGTSSAEIIHRLHFVSTDLPMRPMPPVALDIGGYKALRLANAVRIGTLDANNRPLHGSTIISLPLGAEWNEFGPAVVRVRTAKSAVAGDHLLHAHFVGWQSAIVMKEIARISARAPRHLSGLAAAKVEQHCHRYGHYDEHQSHGSPPARCRAPIPSYRTIILAHMIRKKPCAEQFLELRRVTHRSI